eukprot:Hpha_TRINITY_DN15325_c0_g7::TRINITY_DN15325_c0_g7_i1::g.87775::m.87775
MRCRVIAITLLTGAATGAQAKNVTWTGAGGNNLWFTNANWDTGHFPASENVFVNDPVEILVMSDDEGHIGAGAGTVTLATGASLVFNILSASFDNVAGNGTLTIAGTTKFFDIGSSAANFINCSLLRIQQSAYQPDGVKATVNARRVEVGMDIRLWDHYNIGELVVGPKASVVGAFKSIKNLILSGSGSFTINTCSSKASVFSSVVATGGQWGVTACTGPMVTDSLNLSGSARVYAQSSDSFVGNFTVRHIAAFGTGSLTISKAVQLTLEGTATATGGTELKG